MGSTSNASRKVSRNYTAPTFTPPLTRTPPSLTTPESRTQPNPLSLKVSCRRKPITCGYMTETQANLVYTTSLTSANLITVAALLSLSASTPNYTCQSCWTPYFNPLSHSYPHLLRTSTTPLSSFRSTRMLWNTFYHLFIGDVSSFCISIPLSDGLKAHEVSTAASVHLAEHMLTVCLESIFGLCGLSRLALVVFLIVFLE